MSSIFNNGMLIDQSETLFGKITHHLHPEIRKMLARGMFRNKNSTFHSGI